MKNFTNDPEARKEVPRKFISQQRSPMVNPTEQLNQKQATKIDR